MLRERLPFIFVALVAAFVGSLAGNRVGRAFGIEEGREAERQLARELLDDLNDQHHMLELCEAALKMSAAALDEADQRADFAYQYATRITERASIRCGRAWSR